jgi:predicted XRE-type DNA-binding protein
MKTKVYENLDDLGKDLGLSRDQIEIAKIKTKIKTRIKKLVEKQNMTMTKLAELSGLTRSVVSGIINGSLQSVSLERLIRLASALDLSVDITLKKAA